MKVKELVDVLDVCNSVFFINIFFKRESTDKLMAIAIKDIDNSINYIGKNIEELLDREVSRVYACGETKICIIVK